MNNNFCRKSFCSDFDLTFLTMKLLTPQKTLAITLKNICDNWRQKRTVTGSDWRLIVQNKVSSLQWVAFLMCFIAVGRLVKYTNEPLLENRKGFVKKQQDYFAFVNTKLAKEFEFSKRVNVCPFWSNNEGRRGRVKYISNHNAVFMISYSTSIVLSNTAKRKSSNPALN